MPLQFLNGFLGVFTKAFIKHALNSFTMQSIPSPRVVSSSAEGANAPALRGKIKIEEVEEVSAVQ